MLAGVGTALGTVALAGCTSSDTSSGDDSTGGDTTDDSAGNDTTDDPESGPTDSDSGRDESTDNGGDNVGDDSTDNGGDSGGNDNGGDSSETGDGNDEGCADESVHEGYEETEIEILNPNGEPLGSVTAAIADTSSSRYLGLSDTDCLPTDRGMLFVYQESQPLTFVMRDMDFGIDIVHIDEDGRITSIQHADPPGEGESGEEPKHQYPGTGQFVLEVNYNWTTERGIETGDVVEFDL